MQHIPLFLDDYLFSYWEEEFLEYRESRDADVRQLLVEWSERDLSLTETQLDGLFIEKIFRQLWEYWGTGTPGEIEGYTLLPQYAVPGAGESGGTGKADLCLAHFANSNISDAPQVLCEFKDISSGLDTPQKRKGSDRSPVQQCLDYLRYSYDDIPINAEIVPTWGIVTDMNEFRLYYRKAGRSRYQRFLISSPDADSTLIADSPESARSRFLFVKLFSRTMLLSETGRCELETLIRSQLTHERSLEKNFYKEYQAYRQLVYEAILQENPDFEGTRGDLVRMTQRFLDRCIFLLFCEDMGKALSFPTNLVRDILVRESASPNYSPDFDTIWSLIKQLFNLMKDGGVFPPSFEINAFNGGLFEELDQLESLKVPNRVFCAKGQGESEEKLNESKNTLLYLSATYNFGTSSAARERTITLYALGRIFEQSITDLEYMHAEAEGVPTIAKVSKRRRDGVYYTPEWITNFIVQEVIGTRLTEKRVEIGLKLGSEFKESVLGRYRQAKKKPKKGAVTEHLRKLEEYQNFVNSIKVLDLACGSGAFLIQSLQFLLKHHQDLAQERERVSGQPSLFDQDALIRSIISSNLYGVDINPESVEISQLALWLNTAMPDRPLSNLDSQIRCGNSLVDSKFDGFYLQKHSSLFAEADPSEQEIVNTFDWEQAFPSILGPELLADERGFDCIVGNPPYVKLQHFRKVVPDVAEYLVDARVEESTNSEGAVDEPLYWSTQAKSFDMYLPFIERGIALLNVDGIMGYIAPSVWLLTDYGRGLRKYLLDKRYLERWVDFKDFPVFEEAMTYTALQFFRRRPCSAIKFSEASNGELAAIFEQGEIAYDSLDAVSNWVFLPDSEKSLVDKLDETCTRLDDVNGVSSIFQGVITSADYIYHLKRIAPGRYLHTPPKSDPQEISMEDGVMRPLLSGKEAKRYQEPRTNTYLLFPYDDAGDGRPTLLSAEELSTKFPQAWAHMKRYESVLREREHSSLDDDNWYRFGRNQNIDKQKLRKLGVAQTVPELRVFYDEAGEFCLNNVRVNGIIVDDAIAWYVLGALNSRVADFVFRRTAKPKEPRPSGAYFEANKQYIAPIPIPDATEHQRNEVTFLAKELHKFHSARRDAIDAVRQRIDSPQMRADPKKPSWIWAEVRDPESWAELNPQGLTGRALKKWAKEHYQKLLGEQIAKIQDQISFGQTMVARVNAGELQFCVGDRCVIDGVYVSEEEAQLILPQWREVARDNFVSETMNAGRIVKRLLDLRDTENAALVAQLSQLSDKVVALEDSIIQKENDLDELFYELYALDAEEKDIVIEGTEKRFSARIPRVKS